MVYITGDTHGNFERIKEFIKEFKTSKNDYLIILGDVGINYYLDESDSKIKEELSSLPITLLCIQGNHEERPNNINTYKEVKMFDGMVYMEDQYSNIIFLKDSSIYNIENKKVLVIGGAYSVLKDKMINEGYKWFRDEQPNKLIKKNTLKNLFINNNSVDIVLSHTCPLKYLPIEKLYPNLNQKNVDKSTEIFLDEIENTINYQNWYCGHFHTDKVIDKMIFMFESIRVFK